MRHLSSLADDVWHKETEAGAYEWWYFDAISDDGRDALVVIFLDNFVFSPRYNRAAAEEFAGGTSAAPHPARFPAVTFCLYRDGRPAARAINEYGAEDFTARTDRPSCRLGRSSFHLETTPYRKRFIVTLDETLRRGRRLAATLEWEVTEGDFLRPRGEPTLLPASAHEWNLVAPRCRVSGRLAINGPDGGRTTNRRFDGTGYHDHNRDRRWMPATVGEWQWGRAHFDDATAVFYRYRERGARAPVTRLFIVQDGALSAHPADLLTDDLRRDRFGLRYPRHLRVAVEDELGGATLRINQHHTVDRSFFYLRFLSDAALDVGDGRARRATAITEHLAPRALRWRWLYWLIDMRIGRNARGSFLP